MTQQLQRAKPEESFGIAATQNPTTTDTDGPVGMPTIPDNVTSPFAKLTYLYLQQVGRADVADLSMATDVPQIRLYPVLKSLVEVGHLERDGSTFIFGN